MFTTAYDALLTVERLIAFAVLLQTAELWQIRRVAADDGVWRWEIVRRDLDVFPAVVRRALDAALCYRGFLVLLALRMVAAVYMIAAPHVAFAAVLLVSTLLLALRWRGSVNGGSDFMTLVVLAAVTVATALPDRPMVTVGCLVYIALQTCNSYVIAGLVKLKTASWRRGAALPAFLATAVLDDAALRRALLRHPLLARAVSWATIALECSVPLALLDPVLCSVIVGCLLAFHIANVYVFGLNRFVWAWAATYPALFYCSHVVAGLRAGA
jgi:hypothetical protein